MDSSKNDINTISQPKLILDINESYADSPIYSHAINITLDKENTGTLASANSNTFCVDLPLPFLGAIPLNDDRFIIFLGNEQESEIGIVDEKKCVYTTLIKDPCLGFPSQIITGFAKKQFNGDIITTFGTKNYPTRRINLNKIPFKYTIKDDECKTKIYTSKLNCEETLLFKKINHPCITVSKGEVGSLPNGTYSVSIAYIVDKQPFSDYITPTQRVQLFDKNEGNFSLNVKVDNLDRDFDTYQLILIANIEGVKTNYVIGDYPTFQSSVNISDLGKETIATDLLLTYKKTWESAGIITANSKYAMLADLTSKPILNYQKQAMQIKAKYIIKQVLLKDYIKDPKEISYWSDENYNFSIDLLYDTGEFSKNSHIPGRKANTTDRSVPSGGDVYEWDEDVKPITLENWEVTNTAQEPIPTNNPFINNERIAYTGDMGFFESTDLYDDNLFLYGADACTPIRLHKFPLVPRYENINGQVYVNLKGMQFYNIPYPLDDNKKPVKGIKGYRILRSDRKGGNKTVISAGMFSNVMKYTDLQNKREIMFSNFPYNDLRPNPFLSSGQPVFKGGKEQEFAPLSEYYKDKLSFYSPHSLYNLKYKHGTEFKFVSEEIAEVNGNFEPVFNHPEHQLISNFAIWAAAALGSIEAYIELRGATSKSTTSKKDINKKVGGTDTGVYKNDQTWVTTAPKSPLAVAGTSTAELASMIADAILSGNLAAVKNVVGLIKTVLQLIVTAGVTAVLFTVAAMRYAENILAVIYNLLPYNQYAYQYNSHAFFNQSIPNKEGNIRRKTTSQPEYISPSLHTIDGKIFNNFGKQENVFVSLKKEIAIPKTLDTSRALISEESCGNPTKNIKRKASMYYGYSKIANPNQYGQIGSTAQVVISPCIHPLVYAPNTTHTSPILFGGDCSIGIQSILTKQPIFRQNLAVEYGNELSPNFPKGIEYNYLLYRNIAYPRYYVDSTKYNYSQLLSKNVQNFSKFSKGASSKYNLDCRANDKSNIFSVDDSYFYLYVNGVMEFICEADYNFSNREKTDVPNFTTTQNTSEVFKSTHLAKAEEFKLSKSFSDVYTTEVYSEPLPRDFNPNKQQTSFPNAVIYSLPSFNLQNYDNWQYFLPNNFFSFDSSNFGTLTSIHKLDQDRLIFLFSKSSPFIHTGQDFLELNSGKKVTIGDGGLFAQDPIESMPTDNNYGASTSPYALSSSHFGIHYMSQKRLMSFPNAPKDISRNAVQSFCDDYQPFQLPTYFPTYSLRENPVSGIGNLISFHPYDEIIYFTKRDFIPRDKYASQITFLNNKFYYQGTEIFLRNDRYFEDASWTLGYHLPSQSFISFYDWHPDFTLQTDEHFLTVKNNQLWKHNNPKDSYLKFYGIDYSMEIEPVSIDGQQTLTTRSIEYQIEAWKHIDRNKFHILNENFDTLIVSNTEQISPLLNIVEHPKNPRLRLLYPQKTLTGFDILSAKVENKQRINSFWDSLKDRNIPIPMWNKHPNGYTKTINPLAIDLNKPEKERKKFRGTFTKFLFSKKGLENVQILIKLFVSKKLNSPR